MPESNQIKEQKLLPAAGKAEKWQKSVAAILTEKQSVKE